MPTDTKQLANQEVFELLIAIGEFSECHPDEWRNQVARDLNQIIGRAIWHMETEADESDTAFGNAVIRIVVRVAESEKIVAKGKPSV